MTQRSDVLIPLEFGGSSEVFVKEWCLGGALARNMEEVARALSAIKRHWPQEVTRLATQPSRGVGVVAAAVELGMLLDSCESAQGFPGVLRRLVGGERSAYSELVLVAALRRCGHEPRFAAPIDNRLLDAACNVQGTPVYFEVVAPERSCASAEEQRRIDQLIAEVRHSVSKCRVEIEILDPVDPASVSAIVAVANSAPPGIWTPVHSVARIRRIEAGQALPPIFDGQGTQVVFAGERTAQGDSTSVIACWEGSDVRARRVFNEEYHHFSKKAANVLVVNVCAIPDGMKLWPSEMARLLQPMRNRKVGAVVFFEQGSLGPPETIRRRWRVVVNPHAHSLLPERLLIDLESLDESETYGLQRPERIVAT